METLQLILISLIQGITEFLPISSSGHLILIPHLFNYNDQGIIIDVIANTGSLLAIIFYFRHKLIHLFCEWIKSFSHYSSTDSRLAWYLIIATIPSALSAYLLHHVITNFMRSTWIIAVATLVFGLLLWLAEHQHKKKHTFKKINFTIIILIGLSQILALIPGTSRSGITMTTGLLCGLSRKNAVHFSFLLAIPISLLAASYEGYILFTAHHTIKITLSEIIAILSIAFISAYLCIHYLLHYIEKIGFMPFVIYRILLSCFLFYYSTR